MRPIVLASTSPRRKELMDLLDYPYTTTTPLGDEVIDTTLDIMSAIESLAYQKASSVYDQQEGSIVIGCDTVVIFEDEVLGKPTSRDDAINTLTKLSGNIHQVITSVAILSPKEDIVFSSVVDVEIYPLTQEEIEKYVDTKEPMDKAGSYGIQGKGALLIKQISGDYYSVMGFPIGKINQVLRELI